MVFPTKVDTVVVDPISAQIHDRLIGVDE